MSAAAVSAVVVVVWMATGGATPQWRASVQAHAGVSGPLPARAPGVDVFVPVSSPSAGRPRTESEKVAEFERWMFTRSSLQGAELDGHWGQLDNSGKLVPGNSLRRRFDQLLLLQQEVELQEVSTYVEAASTLAIGSRGAEQVSSLWRKYLALLSREYETRFDLSQPVGWEPALRERRSARRELLGSEWAEAFFGTDERSLEALIQTAAK